MFLKTSSSVRRCCSWAQSPKLELIIVPLILLIVTQVPYAGSLQQDFPQPIFKKDMDSLTIKENTPVGEIVYTLEAQIDRGQQQARILYGIEGTQLFSVDKFSGQVRVAQLIDREQTSDSITFQVTATAIYTTPDQPQRSQTKRSTQLSVTVLILDENDNPPRIEHVRVGNDDYDARRLSGLNLFDSVLSRTPTIRTSISEAAPLESVLVDLIEAVDVDKASSNPLKSTCLSCEPEFEIRSASQNLLNDRLNSSIVLINPLTHIPRNNVRQLHVIVSDGKFNSSIFFEVTIEDVQNKPPQFIGSTTCVVNENVPIDTTITTIQAIDGDAIGIDDSIMPPIKSGLPTGRPILYDLLESSTLTEFNRQFKLHPLTGQLQVADRLDREAYLSLNNVLSLRIRARELKVDPAIVIRSDGLMYDSILQKLAPYVDESPSALSEVDITVILVDLNDNEPHWLNASEIARLNVNTEPNWYTSLPNDRDTGRIYKIFLKENSPFGSPITGKNEMFVYDLDNGENANFNITLDDPFNLFDVEPKQVSGFALVTLKLANPNVIRRTRLLDYENPNERSFIIQLIATGANTTAGKSSSIAKAHIHVLDVNDNAPEFKDSTYHANIREDAPAGKTVVLVQATDKDEISIHLAYSLHGRSAYLFDINRQTGLITVARCEPSQGSMHKSRHPSSKPCIDYEIQRSHHLMVEVSDGELSSKVPLTVFIDDTSDNPPVFTLPVVEVVIEEGADRLDPPIKIEATDVDQSSVLSYSIIEGNFDGLFSINNATGELQLTRPIKIAHGDELTRIEVNGNDYRQQQLNKRNLVIQATDGVFTANGTIRIDVLDANDNAPEFIRPQYFAEIHETASSGHPVTTVKAIDSDRGNNAQVSYRLQRGSYGQFDIDEATGVITVSKQARKFDISKRENYTLEVVAQDHGLVSKSNSVLVYVRVLNTIRRAPEFTPQVQRISVIETTLNNTVIHRMNVSDQDLRELSLLIFQPGPIEALDKNGQPVAVSESERLESMLSVSTDTGDVMVSSPLDHDLASYINLTIYVSSKSPNLPDKISESDIEEFHLRSQGYLIINVIDDNSNAPVFAAPWSPQSNELSFQMLEELPVGSILTQLVASDADSKISHYKIDPPNDYFELTSPQSGIITNKRLIDYDALMRQTFLTPGSHRANLNTSSPFSLAGTNAGNNIIQFNVYVFDSGQPQLSAKATISAEILPVNDWDCKFEQPVYEVRIKENTLPDTLVVQVRAIDMDYGEFHNTVRYQLVGQYSDYFRIDSKNGLITVSDKGSRSLDREGNSGQPVLVLTVVGRDTEMPQVNHSSLGTRPVRGSQQISRTCSATIKVHVDDVNDNPPLFLQKIYELTAYDTDQVDVPIVKLLVRDDDSPNNFAAPGNSSNSKSTPALVNSFRILSGNINDSFNITNKGLIYATKPLNESLDTSDGSFELRVQVKQQSPISASGVLTSFTDECLVRISLSKMNRYVPEWRFNNSEPVSIYENSKPGTLVARLKCVDRDHDSQPNQVRHMIDSGFSNRGSGKFKKNLVNPMRYWIKENGTNTMETAEFRLDPVTGHLVTRVELDRERQAFYLLIVACEDNGKPKSMESVTQLFVPVLDVDDNKPEFIVPQAQDSSINHKPLKSNKNHRPSIRFSVEENQMPGLPVGELKAIDRDVESAFPISYCLIEGNEYQEFHLDRNTGVLYTNQTLDREKQSKYDLIVKAINDGSTCEDHMTMDSSSSSNSTTAGNLTTRAQSESRQSRSRIKDDVGSPQLEDKKLSASGPSFLSVKVDVLDTNDNAPIFKEPVYRAGVPYRSMMNTFVTQIAAFDPDNQLNRTLSYKISEISNHKTSASQNQQTSRGRYIPAPKELATSRTLMQFPFRIDQQGNIYTQDLLTQYQLMSMFVVHIEATELAEPWRTARTKLEIYVYEASSQLKISINLHPRLVEDLCPDIEALLSKATKYTAIINKARIYHGASDSSLNLDPVAKQLSGGKPNYAIPSPSTSGTSKFSDDQRSSTLHLIFVDNFRIVNPNLVMKQFDLTSALFVPQLLTQQSSSPGANNLDNNQDAQHEFTISNGGEQQQAAQQQQVHLNFSSLIDKIALASVQSAEYHSSPSSLVGVDWLENPSILYVALTTLLVLTGFVLFLFGCCCTSRIKDHIVKKAMDKLVKQQALQAKINDQVLAATNQAGLNAGHRNSQNDQEYFLQQGGLMSSFDATKGCITNNHENMNILQRAMESGEFIDPNYTTLNGHVNMGAHYYDASELEQQQNPINGDLGHQIEAGTSKRLDDSNVSLSMADEIDSGGEDLNNQDGQLMKKSKFINHENGINNHQRQRQQIPNN